MLQHWINGIVILSIKGYQQNFIEAHTTLDEVPCNRAGQELDLGENRGLGLIRKSSFTS